MAPKRVVGHDSHYALHRHARKGYNAGSFWLGTVQLGLALLRLAFPSILHFNEWQLHEQSSSRDYSDDDLNPAQRFASVLYADTPQNKEANAHISFIPNSQTQ